MKQLEAISRLISIFQGRDLIIGYSWVIVVCDAMVWIIFAVVLVQFVCHRKHGSDLIVVESNNEEEFFKEWKVFS